VNREPRTANREPRTANREPIEVRLYGGANNATVQVSTRSDNATGCASVVLLHGGPGAPGSVDDLAAVAPESAAIVGHSWGAMLALSYAAYQKAVERRLTPDDTAGLEEIDRQLEAATDQADRDRLFARYGQIFNRADSFDPLPYTAPLPS